LGWHNCFTIRSDDPVRRDLLRRFNLLPKCVKPLGLDKYDLLIFLGTRPGLVEMKRGCP